MLVISPFLLVTASTAVPEYSSGKSMVNSSIGSHFTPSISLITTCGWPTCNSYPSRRIVSIRTDKCITPRPKTCHLSAVAPDSTRIAKFFSNSLFNRSWMWREVKNLPSFPKNGESLMLNNILIVGSSISIVCNGSGFSASQTTSPISKPSMPVNAQMSPACTSDTFLRSIPSKM